MKNPIVAEGRAMLPHVTIGDSAVWARAMAESFADMRR